MWNLLFPGRAERELAREVSAHLALLEDEYQQRGMTPEEARLAALRAYGGVEQAKELHREERSFLWIEQAAQDFRHAIRGLARNPGFTLIAVIALALGIGVNAALFTTYNAVALKPLPVADPDHVVRMERWVASHNLGANQYGFSYPEYLYTREHSQSFSSLVAASWAIALPAGTGQLVSANYFADLGIQPLLGRGFLPEEDQTPGGNPVAVIADEFWKRQFASDPRAIGQTIQLQATSFTIIGVAPPEFTGTPESPTRVDFWAPLSMQAQLVPGQSWLSQPDQKHFQIFARLEPQANRRAAQAQTDLLIRQFATTYVELDKTTAVTLQRTSYLPNTDDIRFQALVGALMLIVVLVLFVACANVGNMLLARGAARQHEISTRLALGASRGRVIRQLLTESVLLSCLGGCAGLITSVWATKLLGVTLQQTAMLAGSDLTGIDWSPDGRVLSYVILISLVAGIFFGLSPALRFTKPESPARGRMAGSRLRNFLVASQVTVSVLLLAIAGLLARGLIRSQTAEPGFRTSDVFLVAADFGNFGTDPASAISRQRRLAERLGERPELASVGLGGLPFSGTWSMEMSAGQPPHRSQGRTLASYASETYFDTLGIPLLRGRAFTPQEAGGSVPLAIISESTAKHFFPAGNPLGQSISLDMDYSGTLTNFEVIGVVRDIRYANLTRLDPAHVYLPTGLAQKRVFAGLLVRIRGDQRQASKAVETTTDASDSDLTPSLHLLNLDQTVVESQRAISRMFAMLAAILAALALTLAGVGIYGVVSYLVSQRTREIGVRITMGATSWDVWTSIIVSGMRPVFFGLVLGLLLAGGLSTVLHQTLVYPGSADFLYGVPFYDPLTFGALICFVLAVAVLSSAVPARRALRVDPMVALRYE
jgi:predicted permease